MIKIALALILAAMLSACSLTYPEDRAPVVGRIAISQKLNGTVVSKMIIDQGNQNVKDVDYDMQSIMVPAVCRGEWINYMMLKVATETNRVILDDHGRQVFADAYTNVRTCVRNNTLNT